MLDQTKNAARTTGPTPLDLAAQEYRIAAEKAELAAREKDYAMEKVLALVDDLKEEGTTTVKTGYFKVSVVQRMNRKLDNSLINKVRSAMRPGAFNAIFRPGPWKLSKRDLDAIQHAEPDQYVIAAKAITATPGKPAIKVEVI